MQLFHYHLVTSQVRTVEARYLGKLGFGLVARYGRMGERTVTAAPGVPWERLERDGFALRLTELQRGALNVVLQPGLWRVPRVDHVGVVMDDDDDFRAVVARAAAWNLPVQQRSTRRTFISTGAGYRVEVHPPRAWIDELLAAHDDLALADLRLRAADPDCTAARGVEAEEVGQRACAVPPRRPRGPAGALRRALRLTRTDRPPGTKEPASTAVHLPQGGGTQ